MTGFGVGVAVLATCLALAAEAQGPSLLYDSGSWVVFRVDATDPSVSQTYCIARTGEASGFFELIGVQGISCLSAETADWQFVEGNRGRVGFFVGGSGFLLGPARYFANGLQACGPHESTNAFVDMLVAPLESAAEKMIDVYSIDVDETGPDGELNALKTLGDPIGRFPAAGMATAVEHWRSCLEGM